MHWALMWLSISMGAFGFVSEFIVDDTAQAVLCWATAATFAAWACFVAITRQKGE